MRGADITQESLFTVAKFDDFVPANHPLRAIRKLADTALQRMSALFDTLYADTGRASIAPEKWRLHDLVAWLHQEKSKDSGGRLEHRQAAQSTSMRYSA